MSDPSQRAAIAETAKAQWRKPGFREKFLDAIRGRKPRPPRCQREKEIVAAAQAKTYQFTSPQGELVEITNLKKFCLENGLDENSMRDVAKGRNSHHQGWTRVGTQLKKYSFISPDGTVYSNIFNLTDFCIEHGLTQPDMWRVGSGESKQRKGWRRFE